MADVFDKIYKIDGREYKKIPDPHNNFGCSKCAFDNDTVNCLGADECWMVGYFVEMGEELKPVNKYRRIRL